MALVDLDAEIKMSNTVTSREVTAFVGSTHYYAKEYTLCSPDHYLVGLPITPRPTEAWARYGISKERIAMGELMMFPPGIVQHGSLSPWTGVRRDICCAFPKASFERLMGDPVEWSETNLRETVNLKSPNIRMAVQRMGQEVISPGFATSIVMDSLASLIAVDLVRHFRREGISTKPPGRMLPKREIDKIDEYIRAHVTEDICLNDLARLGQLSVRHFSRLFKLTTGITIANYVTRTRFEIAQELLSHTRTPVKSIASLVGFSSVSNFTTAFKRLAGVTPSVFRHLS
jgi:AraC family transcriptional regulator